ncbi:uncharacterized protein EHS24_006926 [Apiotrichum porosum]|uniref:Uncharacterized protein n=1 Tax=Apiotrichum porosum TaxID=105984 RepID=A0A427XWI1_9TREE|nr:uncharacterized protein EHS24_006926 [Apiotrichum porosum]RSH83256.1 hypothetical protein EHS24_006926 [Apiotrichum porosum]
MSYPPDTHYYSRYQHYQQASPQQTGEPVAHPSGSIRAIPVGVPLPRQVGPPPVHSPPGFHSPPGLHSPLGLPSPVSVYSDPSSFSPPALAAPISTANSIIGASPQPGLLSPLNFDVVSGPHSRPNSSYGRHYTAQTQVSPTLLPLMTTTTTAATATAQPSHGSGCYPSGYPESVKFSFSLLLTDDHWNKLCVAINQFMFKERMYPFGLHIDRKKSHDAPTSPSGSSAGPSTTVMMVGATAWDGEFEEQIMILIREAVADRDLDIVVHQSRSSQ